MSQNTRKEVLQKLRKQYAKAGRKYRCQLLDQAVELFGYHRKSALRALRVGQPKRVSDPVSRPAGRPRVYDAAQLLPVLKTIWLTAQQPCGRRLESMMVEWVPAFESYHHSLGSSAREQLLQASSATLDRLLRPLRCQYKPRRATTKPGALLRKEIPIRGGGWDQDEPGWIEADTVSLCGGCSSGEFVYVLDGTDICTTWVEMRAMYGRGQHGTLEQLMDIEQSLPFAWLGLDSDNGGEFINRHVLRWCQTGREEPIFYTRSRPYQSNDNAHVEQKNWTHVRQWFGYERHDNPAVVELINELARGALGQLLNLFSPSMKMENKTRDKEGKEHRRYGPAQTPYARVMACGLVKAEKKAELAKLKSELNPFEFKRQSAKAIETNRTQSPGRLRPRPASNKKSENNWVTLILMQRSLFSLRLG